MLSIRSIPAVYRHLLRFVAVMFAADAVWKMLITYNSTQVFGCGQDISAFFFPLQQHTAAWAYKVAHCFKPTLQLLNEIVLAYPNGNSTCIAWSCTPLKQIFILASILIFSSPLCKKQAWHKLWYIPLCSLLLYGVNILRIALIAIVIEQHPEWFEVLHNVILKYAFYLVVFALWGLWEWAVTHHK